MMIQNDCCDDDDCDYDCNEGEDDYFFDNQEELDRLNEDLGQDSAKLAIRITLKINMN